MDADESMMEEEVSDRARRCKDVSSYEKDSFIAELLECEFDFRKSCHDN